MLRLGIREPIISKAEKRGSEERQLEVSSMLNLKLGEQSKMHGECPKRLADGLAHAGKVLCDIDGPTKA